MRRKLFTEVIPDELQQKIGVDSKILSIGSCFSEYMAERLISLKFDCISNPSGILYNPGSIKSLLNRLIEEKRYSAGDLLEHEGIWHSMDHHGRFSGRNKAEVIDNINSEFCIASEQVKACDWLMLTFGTAFVWRLGDDKGNIVANCHRLPASSFTRSELSVESIVNDYALLFNKLKKLNPALKIILTVSPVRHLRDKTSENTYSKSLLCVSVHKLVSLFDFVYYFPSYEIMMDELRDYRFYAEDLVHPNNTARNIIWDKFLSSCFDQSAITYITKMHSINQSVNHRLQTDNPDKINQFAVSQLKKIESLSKSYPNRNFSYETDYFSKLLKS